MELLASDLQIGLLLAFAVFLRIGTAAFLLPPFSANGVSVRFRLVAMLVLAVFLAPMVADQVPSTLGAMLLVSEPLVGLFLGILVRLYIHGLQVAGSIAAQSTSLAQIFGASTSIDPMPAVGNVLLVGGMALFTLSEGHLFVVYYLTETYNLVPLGAGLSADMLTSIGVAQVAKCFALGFALAAPFFVASVLYNVTLGVVNRAMPQLMVAFIGAPAITLGGLVMLALAAPQMLALWQDALLGFLSNPGAGG